MVPTQLRPFVIFFNENIDARLWKEAVRAVKEADITVVVGSSMSVYPAADLLRMVPAGRRLYVIDPAQVCLPEGCCHDYEHIHASASAGLEQLMRKLI